MSVSRRQFIRGAAATGAGFILPSFVGRVFQQLDLTGEPLLDGSRIAVLLFPVPSSSSRRLREPWIQETST